MVVSRNEAIQIVEEAKKQIPPWTQVLDEGFGMVKDKITRDFVKSEFCNAVLLIERTTHEHFREYELMAYEKTISEILRKEQELARHLQENYFAKAVKGEITLPKAMSLMLGEFIDYSYPIVSRLEISLSNMRKKRAGESFQEIIFRLLSLLDVPCERVVGHDIKRLPRTDIVIPSVDLAVKMPDRSYSIACIRTLRERWWKEVPSARGGTRVYLVTMEPKVQKAFPEELEKYGIIAFVTDSQKQTKFPATDYVRPLSELPQNLKLP